MNTLKTLLSARDSFRPTHLKRRRSQTNGVGWWCHRQCANLRRDVVSISPIKTSPSFIRNPNSEEKLSFSPEVVCKILFNSHFIPYFTFVFPSNCAFFLPGFDVRWNQFILFDSWGWPNIESIVSSGETDQFSPFSGMGQPAPTKSGYSWVGLLCLATIGELTSPETPLTFLFGFPIE